MRKFILLSCVFCLVLAIVGEVFAEVETVQEKKKWELSCNKPDECWDKIRETNGPTPEFAVGANHGFPVFSIVKLLRENFGDKVYINKMNNKTKKADLVEGVQAFYINNTFSKPTEKDTFFNIVVVVSSGQLEKDFSMSSHKPQIVDGLKEWEDKMGVQMVEWIRKEIDLQKKVQQKNAEAKGK